MVRYLYTNGSCLYERSSFGIICVIVFLLLQNSDFVVSASSQDRRIQSKFLRGLYSCSGAISIGPHEINAT